MNDDPLLAPIAELVAIHPDCIRSRPTKLQNAMQNFINANEDAGRSPNFRSQMADNLKPVLFLLADESLRMNNELLLRLLKIFKILSRKFENRAKLGPLVSKDLVQVLHQESPVQVASEACNVVLNICYEKENVDRIMGSGGVPPLINFLSSKSEDLQANAAGAIQSICFQKEGREFMREQGVIPAILPLLSSNNIKVQTRSVGAVHNISSEAEAIRIIRRLHGVAPLVGLLKAPSAPICGSAAGALQNLSRETNARDEIHKLGAVVPLTDLLFGDDVQSQVCAAGAILNIIGPLLGSEEQANPQRQALKKLLSLALTVGMLHSSIRDVHAMQQQSSTRLPDQR